MTFVFLAFLLICAVAVTASLGTGIILSRSITRPLRRAAEMMRDISEGEGDLTRRLQSSGRDEIGDMAAFFNRFIEKIQMIIGQITGNAETVASAATKLSETSTHTAESVQALSGSQAIAANERITGVIVEVDQLVVGIAAAIEEQATVIKEVADNISQAAAGVQEANTCIAQSASMSTAIARDIAGVDTEAGQIRGSGELVQMSAAQLSRLSDRLKDLVGQFRV